MLFLLSLLSGREITMISEVFSSNLLICRKVLQFDNKYEAQIVIEEGKLLSLKSV